MKKILPFIVLFSVLGLACNVRATQNPILQYDMETLNVGAMKDLSGNGHDGTITGTTSVAGVYANTKARSFDGISDQIDAGNPALFQIGTGTIATWVKTMATGTFKGILVKGNAYGLWVHNNNLMFYSWGNPGVGVHDSGTVINDGKWHHVAATFQDSVASGSILYVDGAAKLTFTMATLSQTITLLFGTGGGGQYLAGSLDDSYVYDRVLTPGEISSLAALPTFTDKVSTLGTAMISFIVVLGIAVLVLATVPVKKTQEKSLDVWAIVIVIAGTVFLLYVFTNFAVPLFTGGSP